MTKVEKSKIDICFYHLCSKKTEVHKCNHCKRYFCKEHLKAKLPGIPDFKNASSKEMEEWQNKNGHPCIPFIEQMKIEKEIKDEKYRQNLDRFIKSESTKDNLSDNDNIAPEGTPDWFSDVSSLEPKKYDKPYHYRKRRNQTKNILIVISIIAIILFLASQSGILAELVENMSTGTIIEPSKPGFGISTGLTDTDIPEIELQIHYLINEERVSYGLNEIEFNEELSAIARGHSQDMANRYYFEHNSPEGYEFWDRYEQAGFSCEIVVGNTIYMGSENIFNCQNCYNTQDYVARTTVDGWMGSIGHRENILTEYWGSEGIGVAISGSMIYVTQNFC